MLNILENFGKYIIKNLPGARPRYRRDSVKMTEKRQNFIGSRLSTNGDKSIL